VESKGYKEGYKLHQYIINSFIQCLFFAQLNCSRSDKLENSLFFLSVIDDMFQSIVGIACLSEQGIRNTCRRELRYLLELAIKACVVSQKYSDKSVSEQIAEYFGIIKSTNISMIKEIDFYFFDKDLKDNFISESLRMYGDLCAYVHSTPKQMQERIGLMQKGRYIGFEGVNELKELNKEVSITLSFVLVLFFHAIPEWCVGDYIVERDGTTVNSYFSRSKYFAAIDSIFDYKQERQGHLDTVKACREKKVAF
jgi:hypothetical protein